MQTTDFVDTLPLGVLYLITVAIVLLSVEALALGLPPPYEAKDAPIAPRRNDGCFRCDPLDQRAYPDRELSGTPERL